MEVMLQAGEENPTLSGFLEEVALVADIDGLDGLLSIKNFDTSLCEGVMLL